MPESSHPDLRCSFQDAERNPLREAIAVSTRDKIAFFEEMLLLASRSGALAPERLAERDSVGRAAQTGQKNEPDPFFCLFLHNPLAPSGETGHAHEVDSADAPVKQVHDGHGLRYLQDTARGRRNVFEALMEAVKTHSLGQISHALYDVGGEYRRNM